MKKIPVNPTHVKTKQKKMFRKGAEDAGQKSSYNKLRRIKAVITGWKVREIVSSEEAVIRIKRILEE